MFCVSGVKIIYVLAREIGNCERKEYEKSQDQKFTVKALNKHHISIVLRKSTEKYVEVFSEIIN